MLHKLFSQAHPCTNSSIIGSGSVVYKGIAPNAFLAHHMLSDCWIIYSGASADMTGNVKLFRSYSLYTTSASVKIANI